MTRATYVHPQSGSRGGSRADLGGISFRSSWEANFARALNFFSIPWEYEPKEFEFSSVKKGNRFYIPDFRIDLSKFSGKRYPSGTLPRALEDAIRIDPGFWWVEIKGFMSPDSRAKLRRFWGHYPDDFNRTILLTKLGNTYGKSLPSEWGPMMIKDIEASEMIVDDIRPILELGRTLDLPGWEGGKRGS